MNPKNQHPVAFSTIAVLSEQMMQKIKVNN